LIRLCLSFRRTDFRLYLSEKYVEEHPDEVFKTKTELAAEILEDKFQACDGKVEERQANQAFFEVDAGGQIL